MNRIITPVVTALDENKNIDYEGNKKIIDFLIEKNIKGILVLGSSGEFTKFSLEEKKKFFKFYKEYIKDEAELFAGTGCMDYEETVELTNYVHELGYSGSYIITPFYFGITQEEIFHYYNRLAKRVLGDIYIYNFPARTGANISLETLEKLIENNDNIKGIKDSVQEPRHTTNIALELGKNIEVYSGFDDQYLINLISSGSGCIGALSNIVPDIWTDLVNSINNKNYEKSLKLSKLISKLMELYELESNFSMLFKSLLIYRGVEIENHSIIPYDNLNNNNLEKAKEILDNVLNEYKNI